LKREVFRVIIYLRISIFIFVWKGRGLYMVSSEERKYSLSELRKGMTIKSKEQLSNIYDVWIILVKKNDGDSDYTIGYIGKETNSESDLLFTSGNIICPVYNDSLNTDGDIYEE
jgi:hypothetical protein